MFLRPPAHASASVPASVPATSQPGIKVNLLYFHENMEIRIFKFPGIRLGVRPSARPSVYRLRFQDLLGRRGLPSTGSRARPPSTAEHRISCSAAEDCQARDLVLGRPSTVRPPSVHCLSAVRPPSVHRPSTVRACIVKQYKKFLKFQISSKIQKLKFSNFHAFLDFIRPSSVRPSAFIRPPSLRPTQPASQLANFYFNQYR